MKHLFVPYELALKLKEKGFDEPCLAFYTNNNQHYVNGTFFLHTSHPFTECELEVLKSGTDYCILAPLYQQVIDWFDSKNIHIIPTYSSDVWGYKILYRSGEVYNNEWLHRHQAMKVAIEEALKLI